MDAVVLYLTGPLAGPVILVVLHVILFMAPAYFANMAPVSAAKHNWFPALNLPVWEEALGANKTWRGLVVGYFAALATLLALWALASLGLLGTTYINYTSLPLHMFPVVALLFAGGALGGDMVESYFKRKRGIGSGKPWPVWDQIDFVLGTLVTTSPMFIDWFADPPRLNKYAVMAIAALVLTYGLNVLISKVAVRLRYKATF